MNKLIYITSLSFPARFANQIQVIAMAHAFSRLLGSHFLFVCSGAENEDLREIPHQLVKDNFSKRLFLSSICYYFFWMPFFLISKKVKNHETVLYFKDTRLAAFAIFWKRLFLIDIKIFIEAHIPFPRDITIERYTFSKVDHVVTITRLMVEILKNQYDVLPEKISLLPNGINLEKFDLKISREEARKITNLPLDKKIVLYSGSVGYYKWKGEDVFIESARFLDNNFLFVVVGGDSIDAKRAIEKPLPNNVFCVDRQPYSQIPFYLKAADILILPSKSGYKLSEELTSPLKLFEYMASRVPIIASDLPSIREVLNDDNALLIKPNNPKVLADSIKKIIGDNNKARLISNQSRIDVEKYEWKGRANKILDKPGIRNN